MFVCSLVFLFFFCLAQVLDTRQTFLNLCQGNHYQFDMLRRGKHSSMMVSQNAKSSLQLPYRLLTADTYVHMFFFLLRIVTSTFQLNSQALVCTNNIAGEHILVVRAKRGGVKHGGGTWFLASIVGSSYYISPPRVVQHSPIMLYSSISVLPFWLVGVFLLPLFFPGGYASSSSLPVITGPTPFEPRTADFLFPTHNIWTSRTRIYREN